MKNIIYSPLSFICRKKKHSVFILLILLLKGTPYSDINDIYFRHLYQRTTYLECLLTPSAWWANPACIKNSDKIRLISTNVFPLGDTMLISAARLVIPINNNINIGAGVMGAGIYSYGSSNTSITHEGMTYETSFAFEHPRFQLGAAFSTENYGSFGVLTSFGAEEKWVGGANNRTDNVFSPAFSWGWISPEPFIPVQFSASFMFIYHNLTHTFWDAQSKLGMRYSIADSLITGSIEYSTSLNSKGFGVFYKEDQDYEALKTVVSFQLSDNFSVLAGISDDIRSPLDGYYNDFSIHTGIKIRDVREYPVFGGYELGTHFGSNWNIMHRVWFGFKFGMPEQNS